MKKRLTIVLLAVLTAVVVIAIVIPVFRVDRTPAWSEDGWAFLHRVGEAIQEYSQAHGGKTPPVLESLYPEYIHDKRVTKKISFFGKRRMAIIYWAPPRLGDACTVTAQLVLDPSTKSDYPWQSIVLWGDGQVRLHKLQPK